jgi:hypothetical protein
MRSASNNGRMQQVDAPKVTAEQRSLSGKSDANTGSDLRPLDQTGFVPALEKGDMASPPYGQGYQMYLQKQFFRNKQKVLSVL